MKKSLYKPTSSEEKLDIKTTGEEKPVKSQVKKSLRPEDQSSEEKLKYTSDPW